MPTQTRFIAPSGGSNLDLSGIFADLDGGTSYGSATNFKVGAIDLTGYFHASTGADDRPNFNTGYKINGTDLSVIFRRRGYSGVVITSQPQTQTKTTTQSVTFSVTFNTLSSVSYQWKKDGANIVGQSGSTGSGNNQTLTYTINSIAITDAAIYTITIGGTTSQNARLNISPRIIATNIAAGSYTRYYGTYGSQDLTLQITSADGETPLSYQWYKDNVSLGSTNGANTTTFSKTSANGDSGVYKCIVSNSYGSATSGNFTISALSGIPVITAQPQSQAVNNNSTATFSVSASANGTTIGYQWKKNGADILGATSPSYTTSALTTANDTDTYFCNVYTNYGSVNSSSVSTKIRPYVTGGTVTGGPYYFTAGANVANFTVTAAGSPTLSYQWQFSTNNSTWGSVLSTSSTYSLGVVTGPSQTGYYRVTVSSTLFGLTYSTTATAYMQVSDVAPAITGGTVTGGPYTFLDGQSVANFNVTATGTNLQYVWYYSSDGSSYSVISGYSTAQGPVKNPAYIADSGYYRVTVSNGAGSATATAQMTVI